MYITLSPQYCLDCYNKLVHPNAPLNKDEVLTNYDICDNCQKNLPVVVQVIKEE